MTEDTNKATRRRVLEEFFSAGNLDLAPELFSPDLVQYHPDEPYKTHGPGGIRERITAWRIAFPDLSTSIEDLVAEMWDTWNVLAVMEPLGLAPAAAT
jgi:hypothetical protein